MEKGESRKRGFPPFVNNSTTAGHFSVIRCGIQTALHKIVDLLWIFLIGNEFALLLGLPAFLDGICKG